MATWPTVTDDDGTGTTGTILDQALFNSVRDYIGAAWTSVAFAAGNFTAGGTMTWTLTSGDQVLFRWVEIGKTMIVTLSVFGSSTGGAANAELRFAVPNGRTIGSGAVGAFVYYDNGTSGVGEWIAGGGSTFVSLYQPFALTNWSATSTNNTHVAVTAIFDIV